MDSLSRLRDVVKRKIGGKDLVLVSHSEPYVNYYAEGEVKWRKASGGLVTALDPLMRACGGTWIAYASGEADHEVADRNGIVKVPPDEMKYALKRIRLEKEDLTNYLDGVSHSSLWPWCHFSFVRPEFKDERWEYYRKVNRIFADAVIESIGNRKGFVWIQDYQLSLVGKYIKEKRPDIVTAHFWHIPWPNAEIYKICPWGQEILGSLLYNDLLGFQVRYYANNFLDSADQTLQARVDREQSTVFYKDSQTLVKEFPISIDCHEKKLQEAGKQDMLSLRKHFGIISEKVGVGVDRMDYSKGLVEKFLAVNEFFRRYPAYAGKFTLVQVASPTRSQVPAYKENAEKVFSTAEEVNYRWGNGKWKPIILINEFLSSEEIAGLYGMSDCCLVTSLHDGMNLVSKEYAISKRDGSGMLLLSKFTGASRELKHAVLVNPYAIGETADALKQALEMPIEERKERMARMAQDVQDNDVYKWASDFIEHIAKLSSTVV